MERTFFADSAPQYVVGFRVIFLNEKGERLARDFDSPFLAKEFKKKINKSNKCKFVAYIQEG